MSQFAPLLGLTNGADLTRKHDSSDSPVVDTKTTTISASDIANRADTCTGGAIRLLAVSRIDPRKGLRCLPGAVALLRASGVDARLDIVGPTVGAPGEAERDAIVDDARRRGVDGDVRCVGAVPLQQLLQRYAEYDLFVLPTLPGEGIPRVLLEAMASGLPVVATRVAGIPSLITHERNGILIDEATPAAVADAVSRLVGDAALRRRLIQGGYETARSLTLETQAASMMDVLARRLGLSLRPRAEAAI